MSPPGSSYYYQVTSPSPSPLSLWLPLLLEYLQWLAAPTTHQPGLTGDRFSLEVRVALPLCLRGPSLYPLTPPLPVRYSPDLQQVCPLVLQNILQPALLLPNQGSAVLLLDSSPAIGICWVPDWVPGCLLPWSGPIIHSLPPTWGHPCHSFSLKVTGAPGSLLHKPNHDFWKYLINMF